MNSYHSGNIVVYSIYSYHCRNIVVVCIDLWGKELHRQVGVGIVVTSGKPTWCNGSTLARNGRDVGLSPTLGAVFPISITPTTLVAVIFDPVQTMGCMVVESYLLMYMYGHCLYVYNCKHFKTYIHSICSLQPYDGKLMLWVAHFSTHAPQQRLRAEELPLTQTE